MALIPLSAFIALTLRRWATGAFAIRMRPHFVLGYLALVAALVHMMLSMPATGGANTNGIWFASLATFGLGMQALIGANLQSPGAYRRPLRRWHTSLFWGTAVLALLHVALNGPLAPPPGMGLGAAMTRIGAVSSGGLRPRALKMYENDRSNFAH